MKLQKKILIHFIILFIILSSWSQNNKTCGEIYYTHSMSISKTFTNNFRMKFDNNQSYSEEINIKSTDNTQETKNSEIGLTKTTIIGRENTTPMFFYNNKKEFYFREIFSNETLLVEEDEFEWKWDLHSETKKIGKFICQKATIDFRGRSYTAWFTNEIPVPFGPWKFQGLSGLILEVYDTDKVFHITSSKIQIGEKVDCMINIDKESLKKAISITEYLNEKEKIINAIFAKLSSKMPKGSESLKLDKNCEDCPKGLEIFDEEK
ncbi:MAG TPA: GLPGLI family protein [Flavobacteriaceae bacterium]|nr:GLPGLI family protein [Flavobacteriaceae bacterium]HBS11883.1 GLPGLI family protein [Flavobacteriaceae bacterium]